MDSWCTLATPQAHEDDAQRAVHTGLEIVTAMGTLNAHLAALHGVQLTVRLGIHTGLVVVGEVGSRGRHEHLALGETPNIAARIQSLAAPDTVVISAATYRLVHGYFDCADLDVQTLKGVATPQQVYRVAQARGTPSRLEVAATKGLTPLIGREPEVTLLRERWQQTQAGEGHAVLLTGEAGIGKSRLVQVLQESVTADPHVRVEWRCSPYAQQSPWHPVTMHLHRLLHWRLDDTPEDKLHALEETLTAYGFALPEVVPLFAALLSLPLPERYPPLTLTPQRQRQQTLETLLTWVVAEATRQPVLFIVEDLHWIDPSTLEFLTLLLDRGPTVRLLTLLTCRPEFAIPWGFRTHLTPLTLTRLPHPQVTQMIGQVAGGKALPPEVVAQIVAKTDGVPLFVEELTKTVLESGLLQEREARYELTGPLLPFAIPATLHDSLMARLDRLATVKDVAQLGATIGRTFDYALLQRISPLDEGTLQQSLRQLVSAELVYQHGMPPQATYTFKHALIQDAAYHSLLRSTRQQFHQRIARVLETQFPEMTETQPELLAHHYTEAGLGQQALVYWLRAGQHANERSAHVEAVAHLSKGLALLPTLPDTPERLHHELQLLLALGAAQIATTSYAAPEVAQTYTRARQLCHHLDDHSQLFTVLRGLWNYYNVHAEPQTARALGEQLLTLAQQAQDPALLLVAHRALGATLQTLGANAAAHAHYAQSIALYDPQQHRADAFRYGEDAGVVCRSHDGCVLWRLGYPDQGRGRTVEAVTLAQQLAHPFSLGFALAIGAMFHQFRRERSAVQEYAAAATRLATEQGFPYWQALGVILRGWVLAHQGQPQEGLAQIEQGMTAWRATGAEVFRPYFLAIRAEAYGLRGQPEAGLTVLGEALTLVANTDERWYEPELYRLKGALLLQRSTDHHAAAQTCFQQALAVARRQEAKAWELRAATSLSRLWQQQGQCVEVYELLAPIYGWFTEGLDTADLQEAKALLEALS